MCKNTFCSHFRHCGWHFKHFYCRQLKNGKLNEVLARYANIGKETLSPFTWQQYWKCSAPYRYRLYQSLLTLQTFLNFIWWTHWCKTVKPCNRPAVGAHKLGQMEFIDVFPFILTRIMPGLLSPGSISHDIFYHWLRCLGLLGNSRSH